MAEMSSMGIGNKPCLDIRPSDNQISDRSISFAQLSRSKSTMLLQLKTIAIFPAVPRFRNSIVGTVTEACRNVKRPHSVISMSSVSSSSTSSGGSAGIPAGQGGSIGHGSFESTCDSPKPYHKSATLNSQCSVGGYL
nr:unnamed protein product [Callosobruchus chinensis]